MDADRTSRFAFVQLHEKATRRIASDFLRAVAEAMPLKIHTGLTDNGVQFIHDLPNRGTPEEEAAIDAYWAARGEPRIHLVHALDHACTQLGIEHRTTKPCHPSTDGQVERMNRTIKEATIRRYHSGTHDELRAHLKLFVDASDYGRGPKPFAASHPTKPSAKAGPSNQDASKSTPQTTLRDWASSLSSL